MSDYNSPYTGAEMDEAFEAALKIARGESDFVTQEELSTAISEAITTTLNTEV